MSKTTHNLNEAVDAFLKALLDYETATFKMNQSLQRFASHNLAMRASLRSIIHASGTMIASRQFSR